MELIPRHLRYLATIGEFGSFVSAANFLNISQPALSLSIKRAEDIAKTKLVERDRNGATLTPAGELLARRGIEIEAAISAATEEIGLLSHNIKGTLRIGGTPLITSGIFPDIISKILDDNKNISISMHEGLDDDLLVMLNQNELDLVISSPGIEVDRSFFNTTPLFATKTVLVVHPKHHLLSEKNVTLADLQNLIWAVPIKGGVFRSQLEALFTVCGVAFPKKLIQAQSIHSLKKIIEKTEAVTLASEHVVHDEIKTGRLSCLEIVEPIAERQFGLHTSNGRELSEFGKLFCSVVIDKYAKKT